MNLLRYKVTLVRHGLNLGLRILSLGSKFLLILYITKYLGTEELGAYGLFNTSILIGIQLLGFDFYVYNTRELLGDKRREPFVVNQVYFHCGLYLVALPVCFFLLPQSVFGHADHLLFFVSILVLEHLSSECYRLLLTFKETLLASFVLFVRTSSWILVVIMFWELGMWPKDLTFLYRAWLVGNAVSLAIPIAFFYRAFSWSQNDLLLLRSWIVNGIKISAPFFACTILLKGLEYSNRYVLDYFHDKESVGVYTFYSNFAATLSIAVFTLVTMVRFPTLVSLGNKGVSAEFKAYALKFSRDSSVYALVLAPLVALLVAVIVLYLERHSYWEHYYAFLVMVIANVFISMNYATHYILFALKKDSVILLSNFAGVTACIVLNFLLIPMQDLLGASIAVATGFLMVLSIQYYIINKTLTRLP